MTETAIILTDVLRGKELCEYLSRSPGAVYRRWSEERVVIGTTRRNRTLLSETTDGGYTRQNWASDFESYPDEFALVSPAPAPDTVPVPRETLEQVRALVNRAYSELDEATSNHTRGVRDPLDEAGGLLDDLLKEGD